MQVGNIYGGGTLPPEIRSRLISGVNGLNVHVLEAGFETPGRPAILLLHGFPEIAYSWRKIMVPLSEAGYHVIAPDVRGYGRTVATDPSHDADEISLRIMNLVRDAIALVFALGHRQVAAVLGHDAGSPVAAWAALARPDIFRSVVLLSTPFAGGPSLPFGDAVTPPPAAAIHSLETDAALAHLDPPRRHYIRWFGSPGANADMMSASQGLAAFMRAYYHGKSADWPGNRPHRLASSAAAELAKIPRYYVMDRAYGMAETVAAFMPSPESECCWLTDKELAVYVEEYGRTGYDGGLWAYRRAIAGKGDPERLTHVNRRIAVPTCFISGAQDWGVWQAPGALEAMEERACDDYRGTHLVEGAGHWVQQEQPAAVVQLTLDFLAGCRD